MVGGGSSEARVVFSREGEGCGGPCPALSSEARWVVHHSKDLVRADKFNFKNELNPRTS